MSDAVDIQDLAPLAELIDLLPKIGRAKERARLGSALQKATASADLYDSFPDRLNDLATLLSAIDLDKEELRGELVPTLATIMKMGRTLGGEPTIDQLDAINQAEIALLPFQIDKIEARIEVLWRRAVHADLGGQAALGEVLSAIPGVDALGHDLKALALRTRALDDAKIASLQRIAERDALRKEASALQERLLEAGIAAPIADFLVLVAASPVRLSDLTDEIFEWIRSHGALSLFSVSAHGA